jgi:hypothetical protein
LWLKHLVALPRLWPVKNATDPDHAPGFGMPVLSGLDTKASRFNPFASAVRSQSPPAQMEA